MAWSWDSIISGAISGGLIGAGASLLAPWSSWGVEKKRGLIAARKNRVLRWRNMVVAASQVFYSNGSEPFRKRLKENTDFRDLRAHLTPGLAIEIDREFPNNKVESELELRDLILDEINGVEKEWELI